MAENEETLTLLPENRVITVPKGDWVIDVHAENRKIEVPGSCS